MLYLPLRTTPPQCVTLEPGHERSRWRIVVTIVHRFLKKRDVIKGRYSDIQLSSAGTRLKKRGGPKVDNDGFTINVPLGSTGTVAAFALVGKGGGGGGGGGGGRVERGRRGRCGRPGGTAHCPGRRACTPLWTRAFRT